MQPDSSRLPAYLALTATLFALVVIYLDTARSIVSIWNRSETFAHGYVILPISLWLIWKRRNALAQMPPAPFWPALVFLVACGSGWLLAELSDVQVLRQYAFVAMIPLTVLAILGLEISWSMAFPLVFLLLAVPFGEIFIAPLISFTADFTVAALQATGIPVLRNGNSFEIPSGSWSVVEACSGVRYLISSFTLGCLYAHLSYRSRLRQAIFVMLSIVVPIVANGLRAYMIVMIGHLSGMELATGVDHLIYGWVFFGLVTFLMFWIGSFWREDRYEEEPCRTTGRSSTMPSPTSARRTAATAVVAVTCVGVLPFYAKFINRTVFNPNAADLASFKAQWQESTPFTDWKPHFSPASAELRRFFQHGAHKVGVSLMFYRNQRHGSELISSSNRLVVEKDPLWHKAAASSRREIIADRELIVREAQIQGVSGPLLVWYWYWVDGRFTASDYIGKILQAKEKFLLRGDDGAAIILFAPYVAPPDEVREALRGFLNENFTSLETAMIVNKKQ